MTDVQAMVAEFHEAFDVPNNLGQTPNAEVERKELRLALLAEEWDEFQEAVGSIYELHPEYEGYRPADTVEVADALADLVYVAFGAALEFGIDLNAVLAEVHRSNMAKLGADGKPILRDDGKILKPEGWTPPDIARVLGLEKTDD